MQALLTRKLSLVVNAASADLQILARSEGWKQLKLGQSDSLRTQLCKVTFGDFDLWLRSLVARSLHGDGGAVGPEEESYRRVQARLEDGALVSGRLVVSFPEPCSGNGYDLSEAMFPVVVSLRNTIMSPCPATSWLDEEESAFYVEDLPSYGSSSSTIFDYKYSSTLSSSTVCSDDSDLELCEEQMRQLGCY